MSLIFLPMDDDGQLGLWLTAGITLICDKSKMQLGGSLVSAPGGQCEHVKNRSQRRAQNITLRPNSDATGTLFLCVGFVTNRDTKHMQFQKLLVRPCLRKGLTFLVRQLAAVPTFKNAPPHGAIRIDGHRRLNQLPPFVPSWYMISAVFDNRRRRSTPSTNRRHSGIAVQTRRNAPRLSRKP